MWLNRESHSLVDIKHILTFRHCSTLDGKRLNTLGAQKNVVLDRALVLNQLYNWLNKCMTTSVNTCFTFHLSNDLESKVKS